MRVAYSPERAIPGNMLHELTNNDRVVGGVTGACAAAAAGLYRVFVRGRCHVTGARTAELVKLTENAYRDVNIAFANEVSLVCDSLGMDPWELIGLANRHPRVDILQPGPGVGGHCIAVDPWFIVHSAPERTPLIRAARQVNGGKPLWVAEQVLAACQGIEAPVIACLGLAYKADVGDLRESPAIAVIERLQETCPGRLLVVEPHVDDLPPGLATGGRTELVSLDRALAADVIVLLTDHEEFRRVDPGCLAGKRVIDTRGIGSLCGRSVSWRADHSRNTNPRTCHLRSGELLRALDGTPIADYPELQAGSHDHRSVNLTWDRNTWRTCRRTFTRSVTPSTFSSAWIATRGKY